VLRWCPVPRGPDSNRLGRLQARLLGFSRPIAVCGIAALVAIAGGWMAVRYVGSDPFEYDLRELRARNARIDETDAWTQESDRVFGRGISGSTFIAVDRPDQIPQVVAALQEIDRKRAPAPPVLGDIRSILDLVPHDQPRRIAVLDEIRALLDDPGLAALGDAERADLDALRPPEQLVPYGVEAIPPSVLGKLRERGGRVGLLVSVRAGPGTDESNGRDLIRFANAVRRIELQNGEVVTTSGFAVIFADIIRALEHDAPRVTLFASIGLVSMLLLVGDRGRRTLATLAATAVGAVTLVAVCSVLRIRVNFLDFVALPITLGLGVDYAINVAYPEGDPLGSGDILRSAGASVLVCSLTTMIGYGSLMVSENLAIRSFGVVSLLGEVCTVLAALIVVPAILALRARRS
jgi:hypothetical protein